MSHNCELYTLNILLAAAFPEMLIISMELQNKKMSDRQKLELHGFSHFVGVENRF